MEKQKSKVPKSQTAYTAWAILAVVVLFAIILLVKQVNRVFDYNIQADLNISEASASTSLSFSPTSVSAPLNQNFNVDIMLDSGGEFIDGVDLFYVKFNPAMLQIVDSDAGAAGVQISAGTLLPVTLANSANNSAGTLQFSQTTTGGSTYQGSGKLATITFKSVAGTTATTSNLTFDFTQGSTTDSNVSAAGSDKLSVVQNASIALDSTPPTVALTSPTNGSTVSGTVNLTATATDASGIAGIQFKVDGSNVGAEDSSSPYTVSWNTTSLSNAAHVITATARDVSGLTSVATANVTVTNSLTKTTNIVLSLEGRTNKTIAGTVSLLNSSKVKLQDYNFTTNSAGQATITASLLPQNVYLKITAPGYLTRILGPYDYSNLPASLTFPVLFTGDLNRDNIVNSIDYSAMNSKWFTNDATADLNQDSIVNTIDFSLLNKNWFVSGEN